MRPEDVERLQDMLAAAQDALHFATGRAESDLAADRMLFLAMVKAVEIVGEAASRLSAETREQYPQVAWTGIIGMRNILVHAYGSIDTGEMWKTVQNDLPSLVTELERILAAQEEASDGESLQ
jgi:uncharacterized protein with HEPN domain